MKRVLREQIPVDGEQMENHDGQRTGGIAMGGERCDVSVCLVTGVGTRRQMSTTKGTGAGHPASKKDNSTNNVQLETRDDDGPRQRRRASVGIMFSWRALGWVLRCLALALIEGCTGIPSAEWGGGW